jgi:hypothetical protein
MYGLAGHKYTPGLGPNKVLDKLHLDKGRLHLSQGLKLPGKRGRKHNGSNSTKSR